MSEDKNRGIGKKEVSFKTLKIKPETYRKIISCKSRLESENFELLSFDSVINQLVENFDPSSIKKVNKEREK